MLDLRTVNEIFLRAASRGSKRVILYLDKTGAWQPILSLDLRERVRRMAAFLRRSGIQRGDRVIISAENRWEWPVADFAILALGAVSVPLYPTEVADQVAYMINDSGARIAIVSTAAQYKKIQSVREKLQLTRIIMMDDAPESDAAINADHFSEILAEESPEYPNTQLDADAHAATPDSLATIIYTSGTTGVSKGVMLTHGNIASNVNVSTIPFGFSSADSCISFLPLSHITARHLDYALFCYGSTIAYCTKFEYLVEAMKNVQPTIFVAVPRVYEKVRQSVEHKASASPVRSRILAWAVKTGGNNRDKFLSGHRPTSISYSLAAKLVYSKIQQAFGGRVRLFISGGAPLGIDTAAWFADVGIQILEGYGLSETSPVISLNNAGKYRIGSVGPILPNVGCRIAEDGEVEVSGPAVFIGYWNKPEQTAEAFTSDTPDHWFRTGDIGRIDSDGFLFITDRKKELIKTSGGKFIAPQPIENKLKSNMLVAQAAMVGDKHKFASVLISPNFEALTTWAASHGIDTASRAALVRDPKVIELYQQIIDKVNATLANYETIKRAIIVAEEWSVESGELTPSLKLKRRIIAEHYNSQIAALYHD